MGRPQWAPDGPDDRVDVNALASSACLGGITCSGSAFGRG